MTTEVRKNCPECPPEKRASMSIEVDSGLFYCHRCGFRGRVKLTDHISRQKVFEYLMIDTLPKPISQPFDSYSFDSIDMRAALRYLKSRNIPEWQIKKYNMCLCMEGRYKDRIVIYSADQKYFVARSFRKLVSPPYLNPHMPKGKIVFKTYFGTAPVAVIVEGPFDALRVDQCKFPSIALMTKRATPEQIQTIRSLTKRAVVMLDADAHIESCALYDELHYYIPTSKVLLEKGDPADQQKTFLQEKIYESLSNLKLG